ncbi:MAG: hypothetical protein VX656_09185 [Candidatus Latescibacterota bacterium]|nr:hypothetical protein [Candidatus Latescibacterota bacterium]
MTTTELRDFSQLVDRYEALLRTVYTGAVVGNVEGIPSITCPRPEIPLPLSIGY